MKRVLAGLVGGLLLSVGLGLAGPAAAAGCPPDSVRSGTVCIDKYEVSVWLVAPAQTNLIKKIQEGKATLADLQAGGFQRGLAAGDLSPDCPVSGAGCTDVYAVSIAGGDPLRVHQLVSGRGGGPELAQAPGDQSGVAGGGPGDPGWGPVT